MDLNDNELNRMFEYIIRRKPSLEIDVNIKGFFHDKCILIIGGAGSIGRNVSKVISSFNPKKIIILDQAETPLHNIELDIKSNFSNINIECLLADIRQVEILKSVFKQNRIDIVYHIAAYKHVHIMEKTPLQAILTNIGGTKNIVDLSIEFNVSKFIFISSDKAVNPSSIMGASKKTAELYIQSTQKLNLEKANFSIVRFGNVFGSDGSVIPLFKKQIKETNKITITNPNAKRYFISIHEACQLIIITTLIGQKGNSYMLNTHNKIKMIKIAKRIIKFYDLIPDIDVDIDLIGLRSGEKLTEELIIKGTEIFTTPYKDIIMIKNEVEDSEETRNEINDLIKTAVNDSKSEMIKKMKVIVPEYISQNPEYNILDI